ncbi:hypothetical protein JZ751_002128 [Albula glossodonta]|uniref:Ig-like domain-containing protein n=1 Tax=Albula glossodonta TaxID=121402 RepID=A0A8T2P4J1_9TELE|nr:hypothetical protein JZ751_002128 [Albula glossodonta]
MVNGTELDTQTDFRYSLIEGSLLISEPSEGRDSGRYQCKVANSLGTILSREALLQSLYKPPIQKRTADLQWRVIDGAVATNRHLVHLDPAGAFHHRGSSDSSLGQITLFGPHLTRQVFSGHMTAASLNSGPTEVANFGLRCDAELIGWSVWHRAPAGVQHPAETTAIREYRFLERVYMDLRFPSRTLPKASHCLRQPSFFPSCILVPCVPQWTGVSMGTLTDLGNFTGRTRGGVSVREGQGVVLMCTPPSHSPGNHPLSPHTATI